MSRSMETIREMARLTMLSNKLNDVQLHNLKMYPLVFFENVSEVAVEYDLSNQLDVSTEEDTKNIDIKYDFVTTSDHLHVTYHITREDLPMDHEKARYDHLEAAVRNLLWKEIKVNVLINGKKTFESAK